MSQKDKDTDTKEATSAEDSAAETEKDVEVKETDGEAAKPADDAADADADKADADAGKADADAGKADADADADKADADADADDDADKADADADDDADKADADDDADKADADADADDDADKADADADADKADADADDDASKVDADADKADADADKADADADKADADDAADKADADDDADADADKADADAGDESAKDDEPAEEAKSDDAKPAKVTSGGKVYGLLAEYRSPGELIHAASKVRDAGYTKWDCYSPFPVHGLDAAMAIKRTVLPIIVFVIGLCGLAGGLALQYWANAYNWPWIVSGKPFFSLPANIPITFETTILASAIGTFLTMWILNKLPQVWHPLFKQDRFLKVTDDGFFIGIEADDDKFKLAKTEALLREHGALAIDVCEADTDPNRRKMPKPLLAFIFVTISLALIPPALIYKARHNKSSEPHIHIFPDMDFQMKNKAQTTTDLFDDARSARLPVAGTVARGQLKDTDHYYRGIHNGQWATNFPSQFPLGPKGMERGQAKYGIFCAPCHGLNGQGQGMVHERTKRLQPDAKSSWVPPSNLNDPAIVRQPHGQLFNTISNGIRSMSGYAAQISEEDRWAIVLYLRALQRSQNATLNDVPPESRKNLQ